MTRWLLAALYSIVVVLCWFVPPLATLHYPAGIVWATTAFFGAGWFSCQQFVQQGEAKVLDVARKHLPLLGIPLAGLLLPGLWRVHCDLIAGVGYFLLFPLCSALFATALAYWLTSRRTTHTIWRFTGVGLLIMLLGPLYDLGLHPQFYTYNHVFGGVLAPIYDRFLPFHPGLIAFRGTTVLWIALLWARGHAVRYGWSIGAATVAGPVAFALAAAYLFSGELRINTTANQLQQSFEGHHTTAHFDVHYDPADLDSTEVLRIGDDLEFERARLINDLEAGREAPAGIQVYLYPDSETRARLTGAHTTSVAPVWLTQPQAHLLTSRYGSMPHELAHIMTRPYGLPGVNASWSVGLIEGWAVALEAPSRRPGPHDQVLAATPADALSDRATMIERQWTPWGFWSARGGVSYTVFGSFVQSVADTHGHPAIADAYPWGTLARSTGCGLDDLTDAWLSDLRSRPQVDTEARPVAQQRFRIPGFFELPCPYEPIPVEARYQEAQAALSAEDTTAARTTLHAALNEAPDFAPARHLLARLHLGQHQPDSVRQVLGDSTTWTATEWGLAAKAHAQDDAWTEAAAAFRAAWRATPRYQVESRTRWIARALDADDAAADPASSLSDSSWRARLRAIERPIATDTIDSAAHRALHLDRIERSEMPRGWRETWTLRIHLNAVETAHKQRDWPAMHEAACTARAFAETINAAPFIEPLTYAAQRAHWHEADTMAPNCPA